MRHQALKILRSAPSRIAVGLVFLLAAVLLREVFLALLRMATKVRQVPPLWLTPDTQFSVGLASIAYALFGAALMIGLGLTAYRLFVRWLEGRQATEIGRPVAREFVLGTALGSSLVLSVAGALALGGWFHLTGHTPWHFALIPLAAAGTAAVMEELLVRGIVLRILEEKLGSWLALAITAALFGLLHASNRGATTWSIIAVSLSAGLILGSAFVLTRRLWLPIGLHFGVNATEGALLGISVSGHNVQGWFSSNLTGDPFWTGGPFGIEASAMVFPVGALVAASLLALAWHWKRIQPGFWQRSRRVG
jgi:CAAX protease family protein